MDNQQKTYFGQLALNVTRDNGTIGHYARFYITPTGPDAIDNTVTSIKVEGTNVAFGIMYMCYWGGSFLVESAVDGFYKTKSLVWSKSVSDDQGIELENFQKEVEGEDDFVIVPTSVDVDVVNDVNEN